VEGELGPQIAAVGEVVRLAVAPVFLLSSVGVTLTLLAGRLARVVDRARALELGESKTHESELGELGDRLSTLETRARLLGRAIALCTICALLVSMVVVSLFLGALLNVHLALVICAKCSSPREHCASACASHDCERAAERHPGLAATLPCNSLHRCQV